MIRLAYAGQAVACPHCQAEFQARRSDAALLASVAPIQTPPAQPRPSRLVARPDIAEIDEPLMNRVDRMLADTQS